MHWLNGKQSWRIVLAYTSWRFASVSIADYLESVSQLLARRNLATDYFLRALWVADNDQLLFPQC